MAGVCFVLIASAAIAPTSDLTYVGTWTTSMNYPARLASAPGGGVYVTDPPAKQVVHFDSSGAVLHTYSIPEGPVGIAVHGDGRVFLSRNDGKIGVYTAAFVFQSLVNAAPRVLTGPNDLALHPGTNELYAVDAGGHQVMVFTESAPNSWTLARAWGMEGPGLGQFESPQAIALDTTLNHVIVTDVDSFRVQVFDTTGIMQFKFGYRILYTADSETAWFARSEGVAVDACSNIYVADALMGTVRAFDSLGKELDPDELPLLEYGTAPGHLREPCDVMISTGRLYVADTNNAAVEVYGIACAGPTAAVAGVGPSEPRGRMGRTTKEQWIRVVDRSNGSYPLRAGVPRMPDNPAEIVAVINTGGFREDLDLNRDRVIDADDLELAVARFGAGTVEDFLNDVPQVASHDAINPPHILDIANRCGRCHSMDGAPGGMLTALGQENLCQSCHSAGKIAGTKWVGAGSLENSHPWNEAADEGVSDGPPPGSDLALHLDNGKIRCGTCHDPHENRPKGACVTGVCEGGPSDRSGCQNNADCAPLVRYMREEIYGRIDVPLGTPPVMRPMTLMDPTLCGNCHTDIVDQWHVAGHADKDAVPFNRNNFSSGNARCRKCHSGFGYIDATDGVPMAQRRADLRVHDCLVCHDIHGGQQEEKLLRAYDTATIFETTTNPSGVPLTGLKESATCISCHNGRDPVTDTGLTPHYLLGGAMLLGINAVTTFRGVAYSVDHSMHEERLRAGTMGCPTCHMAESPAPGHPGAGKVGGHTYNVKVNDPADPDYGFENVANTCAPCHTGLTTFNRTAGGDYDGDGTVEGVQDETRGLMARLEGAITATGAIHVLDPVTRLPRNPWWIVAKCSGGTNPGTTCTTTNTPCTGGGICTTIINPPAERPVVEDAIWNWQFVYNSRDYGVKNTGYAIGLLQVAYKGLTGVAVPGAAYRYFPP